MKFTWESLSVSVGEMSRRAALDCTRQIRLASSVFDAMDDLLDEISWTFVKYAPAVFVLNGETLTDGEYAIGETTRLILPLTQEGYNALPVTLTRRWEEAAKDANGWLWDDIKKVVVVSMSTPTISEPVSDSAQSNEPNPTPPTTMTTGSP